ncbi:MAG: hypothetical protein ACT4OK_06025 [Gemmobacter sp.]
MLNIFADALLIATRMNPEPRHHDTRRTDVKEQLPSERYVFPKLGL